MNVETRMKRAFDLATRSKARRLKVGCIITDRKKDIIGMGYNHMPKGFGDNCEDETPDGLVTKKELIHAEADAICNCAKHGKGLYNATLFVTHSPCIDCAKMIASSGIRVVYYQEEYRLKDGIDFLKKCGIQVFKVNPK